MTVARVPSARLRTLEISGDKKEEERRERERERERRAAASLIADAVIGFVETREGEKDKIYK